MKRPGAIALRETSWALGVWLLLAIGSLDGARAETSAKPEVVLARQFGLTRHPKGEVWITPQEAALRERLEILPQLDRQVRNAERPLLAARDANLHLWAQRQAAEQALKQKTAKLSPNDPLRKQLEEEFKRLDAITVAPDKLAGAPWVQPQLVDFVNTRNALLLHVFAVRRDLQTLSSAYQTLAENQEVQDALRQLGGNQRLGPCADYRTVLPELEKYERSVYAQFLPLYLQSGRVRIGAILNECVPITFTWREGSDATIIPASMAQSAGLQLAERARETTIRGAKGRLLHVRKVALASLRFGSYVLRDVEAYVLAPEDEDYGASIGPAAFAGYRVTVEPAWLRFRIESLPDAKP